MVTFTNKIELKKFTKNEICFFVDKHAGVGVKIKWNDKFTGFRFSHVTKHFTTFK